MVLVAVVVAALAAVTFAGMSRPAAAATPGTPPGPTSATGAAQTGLPDGYDGFADFPKYPIDIGWDLIGWIGEARPVDLVLSDLGQEVSAVWGFDNATQTWDAYFPSATGVPGVNNLDAFDPLDGYFIHTSEPLHFVLVGDPDNPNGGGIESLVPGPIPGTN